MRDRGSAEDREEERGGISRCLHFHAGNLGHISASTTNFSTIEWSFTKRNRLAETTHSGSSGAATWAATVDEADGRAKCVWDSTQIPDTTATAIDTGDTVALKLYVGDSTKFYSFSGIIETLTVTTNSRTGVAEFEVGFKSTGAITDPA
jgi:hypothetical protein